MGWKDLLKSVKLKIALQKSSHHARYFLVKNKDISDLGRPRAVLYRSLSFIRRLLSNFRPHKMSWKSSLQKWSQN